MKYLSRRNLCLSLPALAILANSFAEAQAGGSGSSELTHCTTFQFDKLPVTTNPSGAKTRPVLQGTLPTGEFIEMHETTLMPGQAPHAAHNHVHSEFMLVREGTVEFTYDGKPHEVGPGGVVYAASGQTHGLKNAGSVPANYFVIAIGREPKQS